MSKSLLSFLLLSASSILVLADTWCPKYYPIGTKWTELRLDTTKYDSWYTKNGDEWLPNFESIDYYVKEDTIINFYASDALFTKVCCQREGKPDSLCCLIVENETKTEKYNYDGVRVSCINQEGNMLFPQSIYHFRDWAVGEILSSTRLWTSVASYKASHLGTIQEMGEEYFGGEKKVRYAITDLGHHVIEGIGVTAWAGANCIFGPSEIGEALGIYYPGESPYCTILVHFERNGEVLYNIWPEPGKENTIGRPTPSPSLVREGIFDLQGRKLPKAPQKGIFIQDGKKTIIR